MSKEKNEASVERLSMLRNSVVRLKHERGQQVDTFDPQSKVDLQMQFMESTYGDKNANLIEDFMVIGLDQDTELRYLERQHMNVRPAKVLAPSSVLYMHSKKTDCQRRSVIKEFCFPNGNGEDGRSLVLEKLQTQQE